MLRSIDRHELKKFSFHWSSPLSPKGAGDLYLPLPSGKQSPDNQLGQPTDRGRRQVSVSTGPEDSFLGGGSGWEGNDHQQFLTLLQLNDGVKKQEGVIGHCQEETSREANTGHVGGLGEKKTNQKE